MEEHYGIYHTQDKNFREFAEFGVTERKDYPGTFYVSDGPNGERGGFVYTSTDKARVESECERINAAWKPQYRFFIVVKITIGE